MLKLLALLVITLGSVCAANASSGDAWAEFAAVVEDACRTATADYFTEPTVIVDPFGSESFGLAIVSSETASIVCVFDKETKAVEMGGELPATVTPNAAE